MVETTLFAPTNLPENLFLVKGYSRKKYLGGGRRQAIYFSMGGRCAHFSNYMGPWCLTNSDYIGGGVGRFLILWVVVLHSLRRGEERILSANLVDKCCHKKA